MGSADAFLADGTRGPEASTSAAPGIQHSAHLRHTRLAVAKHVVNGRLADEEGTAVCERDPPVSPWLTEVDVQRFVDSDDEGNPRQGVLVKLLALGSRLPCVKG